LLFDFTRPPAEALRARNERQSLAALEQVRAKWGVEYIICNVVDGKGLGLDRCAWLTGWRHPDGYEPPPTTRGGITVVSLTAALPAQRAAVRTAVLGGGGAGKHAETPQTGGGGALGTLVVSMSPAQAALMGAEPPSSSSSSDEDEEEAAEWTHHPRDLWGAGEIIAVETEDGMEWGVRVMGPAKSGEPTEMRVRFADGTTDDWPVEDFRKLDVVVEASTTRRQAKVLREELSSQAPPSGAADNCLDGAWCGCLDLPITCLKSVRSSHQQLTVASLPSACRPQRHRCASWTWRVGCRALFLQ
jgi:hypothetical protein